MRVRVYDSEADAKVTFKRDPLASTCITIPRQVLGKLLFLERNEHPQDESMAYQFKIFAHLRLIYIYL